MANVKDIPNITKDWQIEFRPQILRIFNGAERTVGNEVCCIFRDDAEALANARLIVAAPELSRVLTACYHALESYAQGNGSPTLAKECAAAALRALVKAEER
jgi:hypothetical protein